MQDIPFADNVTELVNLAREAEGVLKKHREKLAIVDDFMAELRCAADGTEKQLKRLLKQSPRPLIPGSLSGRAQNPNADDAVR
jgi:hypothetical protein